MRNFVIPVVAFIGMGAMASNPLQDSMLETFVKYARIDSQSCEDSVCTYGQHVMALALKDDVESMIRDSKVKGVECELSQENYLYVTVPSNLKRECPTIGISCHLDVTPENVGTNINPVVDTLDGHTIVRTDGSTLLGADDKCGCTISIHLIKALLTDRNLKHGKVTFVFCPNEDIGRAAYGINPAIFSPDILFDLDGTGGEVVTDANFTAVGLTVKFIGHDAHPSEAKAGKLGDATAAAATFIASVPLEHRPENTEGRQGYIHPWSFEKEKDGIDVVVQTRIRYFDKEEGAEFEKILSDALTRIGRDFPNVTTEILYHELQYDNVAYTLHPAAHALVENAAKRIGKNVKFKEERAGTTASMFVAKGLKGGMCVFSGQHHPHTTREYADLQEMEDAYRLMLDIIKSVPEIK